MPTYEEMLNKICFDKTKNQYALFISEDVYKPYGKLMCTLSNTNEKFYLIFATAGIKRGFKYKRSFDIG